MGHGSGAWPTKALTPTERETAIRRFLADAGWAAAERAPLAGDASFRRYERLHRDDRTAVLMDAPPPQEDIRPFTKIARHLVAEGFSAPRIVAEDANTGLLLLEDLGDATFSRVLAGGADEVTHYQAAIDVIVDVQSRSVPEGIAPYDEAVLLREADLLIDWYLPAVKGHPVAEAARAAYHAAWRTLFPAADLGPAVLVLRDYHADNLMWMPDRTGVSKVGLLDFQDALAGSRAYDVVSLLEDARRDVSPKIADAMIRRYVGAVPGLDEARFRTAYAVLGAQRNAKIIGIFTRLWKRDGKPVYLDLIPRVWGLLEGDLAHPALMPVRDWFDREIPAALRRPPRPGS